MAGELISLGLALIGLAGLYMLLRPVPAARAVPSPHRSHVHAGLAPMLHKQKSHAAAGVEIVHAVKRSGD